MINSTGQCEIPLYTAQCPLDIVDTEGASHVFCLVLIWHRTSNAETPPLYRGYRTSSAHARARSIAPNLAMLKHPKPITRNRGVQLRYSLGSVQYGATKLANSMECGETFLGQSARRSKYQIKQQKTFAQSFGQSVAQSFGQSVANTFAQSVAQTRLIEVCRLNFVLH